MIPPKCYRRCAHTLSWKVTDSGEVYVLCEYEDEEIKEEVCEFCQEYEICQW